MFIKLARTRHSDARFACAAGRRMVGPWLETGGEDELSPFRTMGADLAAEFQNNGCMRKLMTQNGFLIGA